MERRYTDATKSESDERRATPFYPKIKSVVAGRPDYSTLPELLRGQKKERSHKCCQIVLNRHATTTQNARV